MKPLKIEQSLTKRQETEPLFTNGQLARLLLPLVVETALAVLVGMADTVMVSSAGEAAISGVSLVDMINCLIINVFAALATGGAVVTSQFLGAKDSRNASRSAGQLVTLSALLGVLVMVGCMVCARGLLRLFFGQIEADVMQSGMTYFLITAVSYPFLALYNAGAAIFRSTGNSAVSMRVSVLMNAINVGGNALCVYGLKMGVAGVAVPTVVSRAVAAVCILALAARPDHAARVVWQDVRRPDGAMAKNILAIGIPSALENSLFQLGRVLVVSMISLFGTVQISANAVANNLDGMGCIVGQAMCLAMITVVGRCVGARDPAQAVAYTRKMLLWDYLLQGATNAAVLLLMPQLLGLYTLSAETAALARTLAFIHCGMGILLWPVAFVLPNALRAANDVRFTMVVSILSMLAWRLSFSYLLCVQLQWGAVGVWWAMVLDWFCRSVCFLWRFARGKWKRCFTPAPKPETATP